MPTTSTPLLLYLLCRVTKFGIEAIHGPHHVAQNSMMYIFPGSNFVRGWPRSQSSTLMEEPANRLSAHSPHRLDLRSQSHWSLLKFALHGSAENNSKSHASQRSLILRIFRIIPVDLATHVAYPTSCLELSQAISRPDVLDADRRGGKSGRRPSSPLHILIGFGITISALGIMT